MEEFFKKLREAFGPFSQDQVDGIMIILAEAAGLPIAHQSYILATAWHETDRKMQPIEEYGKGKGKVYGRKDPKTGFAYFGRGYVQLTWKTNYEKAQKRLRELGVIGDDVDFVRDPSLVMQPHIAAKILVIGMKEGWFTTHKLSDFKDYKSMRAIVNGKDKDDEIAEYAVKFENALRIPVPAPKPVVIEKPKVEEKPQVQHGVLAWIFGAALAAAAAFATWIMNGGH